MSSTVTCGYADSNWELNSSGENACQVYAELQGQCNSTFLIQTAHSTDAPYVPPNNACGCNVVAYNLMGGCAWCQTGLLTGWWLTIDQWVGNCTASMYNPNGIPSTVSTSGINIPDWAFAIPSGTTWSPSQASRVAVPQSSTTFSFSFSTASGSSPSSTNTRFASGDGSSDTRNTYISAGTSVGIALGVILGIWALATILVIIVYVTRQNKRKAWYGPLAAFYSGNGNGYGNAAFPHSGPGQTAPLLYSPHGAGGYSPGQSPPISTPSVGYQIPPTGPPSTTYVPPPPEPNQQGFHGAGAVPAWGGAGNTASVYGPSTAYSGSQTGLSSGMSGAQHSSSQPPPSAGPAGYRGHAEVY